MEETKKITVSFKTSADADSKKSGDGVDTTTTIVFKDWTEADFMAAAAKNVIINQLQPKIRKGERVEREVNASRPGTKGIAVVSYWDALVKIYDGDKIAAAKMSDAFGGAENAIKKLKILQDQALKALEVDTETE